jgi:acetylornithine/succinyldiaminopimelate/putrescine aminotransferase
VSAAQPVSQPSALLCTYAAWPFELVRARGDRVWDAAGHEYIDFYGGHCVCATGHSHPDVVAAVRAQADEFFFYSTAATIPIREAAARRLVDFAPAGLERVFLSNSGAEANENALKAAVFATGRKRILAFDGAFHGRTLLALAVTDEHYGRPFDGMLAPVRRLPFGDEAALRAADLSDVAAAIVEPIQSMAGVRTASAAWLRLLRARCSEAGALLVFDEIQTGMGRLGAPFAADRYGVLPDVITSAKGVASGFPMGATLVTPQVAAAIPASGLGSTFGGGPLACAALSATLAVIDREGLVARAGRLGERIRAGALGGAVTAVRGDGLLLGLVVPGRAAALKAFLLERRILVGGSGEPDVLRLMPPLSVSDDSVAALLAALADFDRETPR